MSIFSYLFNPLVRFQINGFISKLGEKSSSVVSNIPTSEKGSCKQNADKLVPKYWLGSNNPEEQEKNYWTDSKGIWDYGDYLFNSYFSFEKCLRKGANTGENVNNLYYTEDEEIGMDMAICPKISYSKQIMNSQGVIQGTTNFTLTNLEFKKYNSNFNYSYNLDKDNKIVYVKWSGFDDFMKEQFRTKSFTIEVNGSGFGGWNSKNICFKEFTKENGSFTCNLGENFKDYLTIKVTPEIFDNRIYELINYDIKDCEWVS